MELKPNKGPIPPPLLLDLAPIKPLPPATEPSAATSIPPATKTASLPPATPKKRQRSWSVDSSVDEIPKPRKKKRKTASSFWLQHFQGGRGVLDRLNKVQLQLLKDLRVLHNFKEVNGRNVEDPQNFPILGSPQSFVRAGVRRRNENVGRS